MKESRDDVAEKQKDIGATLLGGHGLYNEALLALVSGLCPPLALLGERFLRALGEYPEVELVRMGKGVVRDDLWPDLEKGVDVTAEREAMRRGHPEYFRVGLCFRYKKGDGSRLFLVKLEEIQETDAHRSKEPK